jgi:radical SAM protein with 4Fe4S-binding SPASM domain
MSAASQLLRLASTAGPLRAGKVVTGLVRMHWRYFAFGRGRGLATMLPMTTPMKIHVDPASGCNFRCFFCPQTDPEALRHAGVKAGVMKLPMLQKLVDDLASFPGQVDEFVFGNYGEPLLNKSIAEMVGYAAASGRIREVSLITNAAMLTHEKAQALVDAGLQKIRISVEALSDEGYLKTTKTKTAFAEIVENIRTLHRLSRGKTFIYVKIIDTGLSDVEKRRFFATFTPIANAVSIENLMPITEEAATVVGENGKGMTGVSLSTGRSVCPSPFYSLSVHMDGDVGVCCSDWHHKTNVGSLKEQSLSEIWNGEELRRFRADQLTKSWRQMPQCAGCEMVNHYPVYEDLDQDRDRLTPAYANSCCA